MVGVLLRLPDAAGVDATMPERARNNCAGHHAGRTVGRDAIRWVKAGD